MGKRKSSKPAPKGKKDTLSTSFKCLFCNHEKSVSVTMDKKTTMTGKLKCKDCGQNYQTQVHNLSLAVDVYSDWVDACEEARLQQPPKERPRRNPDTLADHGFAGGARMTMIGNEEDDLDDDDLDAEGEAVPEEDEESDADSLLDSRPAKRRARDSPDERSRGKGGGKHKEKDRRPAKKAVALDDDDDDDD